MGLFTALEIAGPGPDVMVVDSGPPCPEASVENAGTLAIQNKHTVAKPATISRRSSPRSAEPLEHVGVYPPGPTVKPVSIAALIEESRRSNAAQA